MENALVFHNHRKPSENRGTRLHRAVVNAFTACDAQLVVEDDLARFQICDMQGSSLAVRNAISTMITQSFISHNAFFDRTDGDTE